MSENLFGFIYLVGFVVIAFVANYHSNDSSKTITGIAGMFGLVLLIWWIVKFVILGILIAQ